MFYIKICQCLEQLSHTTAISFATSCSGSRYSHLDSQISSGIVIVGVCEVRVPVVLGLLEVVQDLVVTPARIAIPLPCIVVFPIASHVQHVVQDRGSTHDFTARPVTPAVDVTNARATCGQK